jgi:putative nucleotidyltransferase with HDIG domain
MVRSIATLLAAFKLTDTKTQSFAFDRFGLWLHCLAVGVIAERLAGQVRVPDNPEDYFLAGILHDFGKLFFDDYLHEEYLAINHHVAENGDIIQLEKNEFGLAHDEMGEFMANRWNLPKTIASAIAQHHDPQFCQPVTQVNLSSTICVANMLAKAMLLGQSNGFAKGVLSDSVWIQYGFQHADIDAFIGSVISEVKEYVALLKIPQGHFPICTIAPRDDPIVRIEDGGKTDRLLDMFLIRHGWKPQRSAAAAEEGTVNFVIYDLRQGLPNLAVPYNIPVQRQIVLGPAGGLIPVYIPPDVLVISGHLDYLALLHALEYAHESVPSI